MSLPGVLAMRVRAALRHRLPAVLGLVALVALGVGAVLALAAGARRTASAPDRYTAAVGGDADATLVQPSGRPQINAVRALPAVRELHSVTFLTADLATGDQVSLLAGDGLAHSRLVTGRHPVTSHEFTATKSFAERAGLRLGDHITVQTYTQQQADDHTAFVDPPAGPTFEATLVGTQASVSELDDPTPMLLFPPSLLEEPIGVVGTVSLVRLAPGETLATFHTALHGVPGGDAMFFQPGTIVTASVRHAVNAQATGLWIVAGVVAVAVVAALGFVITTFVRLPTSSRQSLRAIGYTPVQTATEEVAGASTVVSAGTAVAVVLAAVASASFPRGFARAVEPDPGHAHLDSVVLVGGAIAMGLAVLVCVAVAARIARRRRSAARPSAVADALSRAGVAPEANVGVRFALSRDGRERLSSATTIAALCVGVAALVGALVFGTSLARLVDDGSRYGYNFGYVAGAPTGGPLDASVMNAARTAPGILGAMALSGGSVSVAGKDVDLVGVTPLRGGLLPTVLAGRFPAAPDEVAVGRLTAESLRLDVGDAMALDGDRGPVAYRVVGVVVLPSVSFGAGGGRGAAMLQSGVMRISAGTEPQQLALRLEPGTTPDMLALGADVKPSSGLSRPADVINAARARSVPTIIAVVVGLLASVVLVQALIGSVRSRRRDVAVLRALGADGPWITRVVHIQATALGVTALAIGIPIGIVAGRATFRAFASDLGLVSTPLVPVVVVGSVAVALLLMANVAASLPAHRARHIPVTTLLRQD
jgi:hypothetical protein